MSVFYWWCFQMHRNDFKSRFRWLSTNSLKISKSETFCPVSNNEIQYNTMSNHGYPFKKYCTHQENYILMFADVQFSPFLFETNLSFPFLTKKFLENESTLSLSFLKITHFMTGLPIPHLPSKTASLHYECRIISIKILAFAAEKTSFQTVTTRQHYEF